MKVDWRIPAIFLYKWMNSTLYSYVLTCLMSLLSYFLKTRVDQQYLIDQDKLNLFMQRSLQKKFVCQINTTGIMD